MDIERISLFENRFWLQILGDHSRFIFHALSPEEEEKINVAQDFADRFDRLLEEARLGMSGNDIAEFNQRAYEQAAAFKEFKLEIMREHITGDIKIQLPPTFINHMLNEIDEYIRILYFLMRSEIPIDHPLLAHKLWLPDASGHAGAVYCDLDAVEKFLRHRSRDFVKDFDALYKKADELAGYTRSCLTEFPALTRLNYQVDDKIKEFMVFLNEVKELRLSKAALGTLMPLLADHMYREECYYLTKLSMVSEIDDPGCDPARPRINP